jgi:hypothetical protein
LTDCVGLVCEIDGAALTDGVVLAVVAGAVLAVVAGVVLAVVAGVVLAVVAGVLLAVVAGVLLAVAAAALAVGLDFGGIFEVGALAVGDAFGAGDVIMSFLVVSLLVFFGPLSILSAGVTLAAG